MRPNLEALFSLLILSTISFKVSYSTGKNSINLCPEIEKEALLNFKKSLKDPSNLLSSWNSAHVNCCNWNGVVCSNKTGHVDELRLQNYDGFQELGGKLNPSLLNLKHLKYLDLSQNDFEETIPSFIGSLTRLEYLDLSNAGFYGTIPHSIGNLSNLRTLNLEGNSYRSGLDVDSIEWLSGLSQLEELNMNYVNLSKQDNWLQVINTLPSLVELRFGYCSLGFVAPLENINNNLSTSLAILDLSYNKFRSFAIPSWIFRLADLTFLDLSGNSFEGPIPNISNTTKLQHIDLSDNKLNSAIPDWLYTCKDLEFAYFSSSSLHGTISKRIANLTSLNTLSFSWNELSGEIPSEIASLCKLQNLDLSVNKLVGNISDSFGNMSDCFLRALESLDLSENQLSGHLTNQFGEFKSLETIRLSGNSLYGPIPVNLGNLLSLETLNMASNKLTGNLPESLGQLFNLKFLHVEDNKLEGVVSEIHFANLTNLMDLYASHNNFTLKVSPTWIPPFSLTSLGLGSWNLGFGSTIPQWLDSQKNVWELDLSCTGISGEVPSWMWEIQYLNLSHNHLHGKIPDIINSDLMCLSSNKFSGPLPRVGSDVSDLDLSNNSFSGDISQFLCGIANETTYSLDVLKLEGNRLTGEIPDCWNKWSSIRVLNLGDNDMFGSIPNSIGFLTNMLSLNLQNNKFFGHIPFSLRNCTKLVNVDLAGNELDGKIPAWIGTRLLNLRFLVLRANKLSGEISPDICNLNSLQILDLSNNGISGIIPRCVDNFTAMATKRSFANQTGGVVYTYYGTGVFAESVSVATKGSESHYDTILPLVTNIDLSKNSLSGDIPKELTSLVELRSLNLSVNHLTGLIPSKIGDMKELESLDLSSNSLSGEMPNSFKVMSSLNYLNVSYNKLTGKIPESTQLRGFDNSSFIGNDLCGPPLTSNCISSGGPKNEHDNESDDHEPSSSEIEWFYVFLSSGYAVGLSIFCTTLILKKSWREAYFELMEEMWNRVYVYFYIKWRKLTRTSV
ncbi:hypothetical protein ABFS83_14G218400 [Erythranthe nasuta]